jgi:hypothetical protein
VELRDVIALLLGAVGTVLGVVNFVRSIRDEQVRLRVTPRLAWNTGGGIITASLAAKVREVVKSCGLPNVGIDVLNLSKFPVIIDEVGLCEGDIRKTGRTPFFRAMSLKDEECPIKLAPHESATLFCREDLSLSYPFTPDTQGYATTSCDHVALGSSHALAEWRTLRMEFARSNVKAAV